MNPPVQIILPQSLINSIGNSNTTWVPLANVSITDTSVHSYSTNSSNIAIIQLGNLLGAGNNQISSYSLWLYNGENQTVTVQPITNIVNDGSYPDINLIPSYTVNSNTSDLRMFPFNSYPIEYISLALSFATAPTSGSVLGILFIYYGG
jgi:hypothetical protein